MTRAIIPYYKITSYLLITVSLLLNTGCVATDMLLASQAFSLVPGFDETLSTPLVKAQLKLSPVPMDRNTRSSFQPYVGENGEPRFVCRNMFFDGEDPKVNNVYYASWLQEWFKQYDYCKNGYEIISNNTERFADSEVYANLGGHLISNGRCKSANQ